MYKVTSRSNQVLSFLYPYEGVMRTVYLEPRQSIEVQEITEEIKSLKSMRLVRVEVKK